VIVKIYREMGKNKRSRGRRGLTLIRIILHYHKNFRWRIEKGKEMAKT
jgi:hypothetical protein